jgi:hypothetical protein
MTKIKPSDGKPVPRLDPKLKAVENRLQVLRDFYELGKKALSAFPEGATYDPKTIRELADERGLSLDMIRKAREFANRYNQADFDELCGLRTPLGMPLTFMHVRRLLAVKNKTKRSALQKKAAKLGWGIAELATAIKRLQGTGSQGGRRLTRPKSAVAALDQIAAHTGEWLRRYEKAWGQGESGPFAVVNASDEKERETLRASLKQTCKLLSQLGLAARELEERLKRVRVRKRRDRRESRRGRPPPRGLRAGRRSEPEIEADEALPSRGKGEREATSYRVPTHGEHGIAKRLLSDREQGR